MKTAMENIKSMIDVNTVVGDPVETPDGQIIIPLSRVTCGFAAGGGEYMETGKKDGNENRPFGGGSGGGVSVRPEGFLVVGNNTVRLLPVDGNASLDRLIDLAPDLASQIQNMFNKDKKNKAKDKEKD
jgi:sporulation protein YtfJ